MPKARTGTLIPKATGYYGKIWVTLPTGEKERRTVALETTDRATAKRRLTKMVRMLGAGELEAAAKEQIAKADLVADIA
jgi:hypothetical protein